MIPPSPIPHGVARPCEVIVGVVSRVRDLTIKNDSDAVVSDELAVLGLGNIGPMLRCPFF